MKIVAALTLAAFSFSSLAPAMAQTAKPAPAPAAKTEPTQRTAKSLDCSKQADAKKVHGKDRRKFMDKCKRS